MGYGHGTIITGSAGEGNVKVQVEDNGGSKYYSANTTMSASLGSGVKAKENAKATLEWDEKKNGLVVTGLR